MLQMRRPLSMSPCVVVIRSTLAKNASGSGSKLPVLNEPRPDSRESWNAHHESLPPGLAPRAPASRRSVPAQAGVRFPAVCLALAAFGAVPASVRAQAEQAPFEARRAAMVRELERYGISDSATLTSMREVPRHEFVPVHLQEQAYDDRPLPIGRGQTISQPYMVAYMTELLRPAANMRVLEVGTGSGYQAAVLAAAGAEVFSIEILGSLAMEARARLDRLGYSVQVRHGDGYAGWSEEAPFDAIIVTAAPGFVPPALVEQLKPGGRMVIPVGELPNDQSLMLVEKSSDGTVQTETLLPVRFVPMVRDTVGPSGWAREATPTREP